MVIQRWQSVLLLAAVILMGLFSFCPIARIDTQHFSFLLDAIGVSYVGEATEGAPSGLYSSNLYFFVLSLLSAIIPLIAIFMYKNMRLQKTLCLVEILFIVASAAAAAVIAYTGFDSATTTVTWLQTALAPVLALMAVILAFNRIKRDENLLRSADRIR